MPLVPDKSISSRERLAVRPDSTLESAWRGPLRKPAWFGHKRSCIARFL